MEATCANCGEPIEWREGDWFHPGAELSEREFEDDRYCHPGDETRGRAVPDEGGDPGPAEG